MLVRSPGFALVAAVSLALGIGFTVSIVSLANGLFLKPFPGVDHSDSLVSIYQRTRGGVGSFESSSYPEFEYYREHCRAFEDVAAFTRWAVTVVDGGQAEQVDVELVSPRYFALLGLRPSVGRVLTRADAERPFVVLSDHYWTRRFARDPAVVGRTIRMGRGAFIVVGVAPRGFAGLESAEEPPGGWIPVGTYREAGIGVSDQDLLHNWFNLSFGVVARLKPEWTVASGKEDLTRVGARLLVEHPERTEKWRPSMGELVPVLFPATHTRVSPGDRPQALGFLALLGGGALLVLVIACLNVANLLLSRTTRRRRELDIRRSLGASAGRLTRQLFTENLVLAAVGTGGGFVLARWMSDLVVRFGPAIGTPPGADTSADVRVLGFAAAIALLSAGSVTVLPVRLLARTTMVAHVRARGTSTNPHQWLIAGQIAISVVLIVVAGLFLGTLRNARAMDVTVKSDEVLLADVNLRMTRKGKDDDTARGSRLYAELLERVKALPGVRSAAFVFVVPLGGRRGGTQVELGPGLAAGPVSVGFNAVTPGYFSTVGLALLAGRDLDPADRPGTTPVAVINEEMARRLFGGRHPIGERFRLTWPPSSVVEIVGVVRDGRFRAFRSEMEPTVYVPLAQRYMPAMTLEVRGVPSGQLVASIRRELAALDPELPLTNVRTARAHFESALSRERFLASLLTTLGLLALLLAAVGVYGTMAFLVAGQTREIGIRMALGAIPRVVLVGVLGRVLGVSAMGLATGLPLAFASTRLLRGFLFGISPTDWLVFAGASLTLICVSLLAAYLPARQAAHVDPVVALRSE